MLVALLLVLHAFSCAWLSSLRKAKGDSLHVIGVWEGRAILSTKLHQGNNSSKSNGVEVAAETLNILQDAELTNAADDDLLSRLEDVRALSFLRGCNEAAQKVGQTDRSLDRDDVACLNADGNVIHVLSGGRDKLGATD